ncbi:hypothetical protein B0J13DRAFT_33091 [Dactylonectria estremocensis]|uniref:Uncharacterized protein n=1 Tax=Dactylonectria estremocensis TaxID=1079267 RepID=A0A9P9JE99_9HYPO|nr:hypothetical protein B0J13DRAFT_33091 [Dactylonectria estremocensis]
MAWRTLPFGLPVASLMFADSTRLHLVPSGSMNTDRISQHQTGVLTQSGLKNRNISTANLNHSSHGSPVSNLMTRPRV